jgi:hypothetical protein
MNRNIATRLSGKVIATEELGYTVSPLKGSDHDITGVMRNSHHNEKIFALRDQDRGQRTSYYITVNFGFRSPVDANVRQSQSSSSCFHLHVCLQKRYPKSRNDQFRPDRLKVGAAHSVAIRRAIRQNLSILIDIKDA